MSVLEDCRSAAIVGLGLVGGSLARDLSARGVRVLAYDTNDAHISAAMEEGIVSVALDDDLATVAQADVIVIAVPVDCAADVLRRIAVHASPASLVTDVGSTKARIVAAASSLGMGQQFVGSHPMAGDHRSGWEASRVGLFANARVYLCLTDDATERQLQRTTAFWRALGAHPMQIAADEHDRKLARASHLPHVLSAALGIALARGGVSRSELGPGGRDVTRLAGSSPDMWTAIARENSVALEIALSDVEREIAAFRQTLSDPDARGLRSRFAAARAWFDEGL
ncbi:MAG TPA: prephenate dehydrogenase/arogenate dehydrogenase family protein [Casimicrobiaceae bacterium]